MGELSIYIMKSAVCLIVFLLFYKISLSNETFHRFNRFALLSIILFSIIIPGIDINRWNEPETSYVQTIIEEAVITPIEDAISVPVLENEDTDNGRYFILAFILYITGIVFFFFKNIYSFIKILRITNSGIKEKSDDCIITITDMKVSPFSWMNHIVISRTDMEENGREILAHEMAHVKNKHSLDLFLADICILIQWFNPAAWILKTELQNVHEFEADESVINNGIDAKNYQLLLIKKAVGSRLYSIANSFNHSKLKKRITMMMKKKSNPWARAKYFYVLPLAAVAVAAFARPEVSEISDEISSVKVSDFSAITESHEVENNYSKPEKFVIVEGTIVDETTGKGIIGASVIERGSTNGTISDENGHFRLQTTENSVIVISYIGKQTYTFIASEREINGLKNNPIKLKDEVQNMDEIVVVGYEPDEQPKKEEKPKQKAGDDEEVFMVVEQMPEYPGGMAECLKYIARNIKYPTLAQEAKIEGRVIVRFVVGTDGYTSDFEILHSVCPALDAEAIRVLAQMPKWKPGMQRGKAVRVKYTIPVTFRLEKKQPEAKIKIMDAPKLSNSNTSGANISLNKSYDKVLIVVDDKVVTPEQFQNIKPGEIASVNVIKNSAAESFYKKFGVTEKKEGVIYVKTKTPSEDNSVSLKVDLGADAAAVGMVKDKLHGEVQKVNTGK